MARNCQTILFQFDIHNSKSIYYYNQTNTKLQLKHHKIYMIYFRKKGINILRGNTKNDELDVFFIMCRRTNRFS